MPKHIEALLESFIQGPNRSIDLAREIEGAIASDFPDEHFLQPLAEDLAQYRPGGGDFLYSEAELLPKVSACLQLLRSRSYIDVLWLHKDKQEPIRLISELDGHRNELRRIEFFSDGSVGYATSTKTDLGVELSIEPIPPLEAINADPQFKGSSITSQDFEALWQRHVVARDA